jgi:hypothetical protein
MGFYNPFKIPPDLSRLAYDTELQSLIMNATITPFDCLFGGDMNIDMLKDSSSKARLNENLMSCGLTQMVNNTTRHRSVNLACGSTRVETSLIDHVYTDNVIKYEVTQQYTDFSDHEFIIVCRDSKLRKKKVIKISARDWRNYGEKKLLKTVKDYDINATNFEESLKKILDRVAPLRSIRIKDSPDQIVHPKLEKKKKRRDRMFKLFRQTNEEEHLKGVRKLSKEIKKMVKRTTRNAVQDKANASARTFWQTVNSLLGNRRQNDIIIHDNQSKNEIKNPSDLVEIFSDFFLKKVNMLSNTDTHPLRNLGLQPARNPLVFSQVSLEKVLKELKPKKCYGTDEIPLLLARDVSKLYPEALLQLLNNAAKFGIPDEWRVARVIPLHKKGSRHDYNNFRPISNLNAVGKIYEKMVLQQLETETDGMEGETQHGFQKNHSTVTALLEIQSFIAKSLDEGRSVVVYSVDLSAAFNLLRSDVFDDIIGPRLSDGLRYSLLDFLSHRTLTVNIKETFSRHQELEVGCVQGSTLGPKLFTLYMSGMDDIIKADK